MTDEKYTPEDAAADDNVTSDVFIEAHDDSARPSGDPDVTFDSVAEAFVALTDGPDAVDAAAAPQYGVGPFSVREVALGGIALIALIVSFFPIYGGLGAGTSVWTGGIDWVLTVGVPVVAVFLLGLRRLSPQGIRRVGSLGIDQFASVAFSVSTVIWLGILWSSFVTLGANRVFYATWVVWVEFILMLAGVLLTVFAPLFPTIGEDFRHRSEVPAHRFASPARPVVARPASARPAPAPRAEYAPVADPSPYAAEAAAYAATPTAYTAEAPVVDTFAEQFASEPVVEQVAAEPAPATQAFWALAPVERDVVDEYGTPVFRIGPTAWALVIEDRGDSFLVRHEDGRVGILTDVTGVTRG